MDNVAKRWSLGVLFLACSAWATYTSFPTAEEKEEYLRLHRVEAEAHSALGQIYTSATSNRPVPDVEDRDIGEMIRTLEEEDFARGFVRTAIGIGETYDFSPSENAVVCEDWLVHGASEDWIYLDLGDWFFYLGTNKVNRLQILSNGVVFPLPFSQNSYFKPFETVLGIVPQGNWQMLSQANTPSCFWYEFTPFDSLKLTWQNALYCRDTNKAVDVQMEIFQNGGFVYRYNLSQAGVWNEDFSSNVIIAASNEGRAESVCLSAITNLTSISFARLNPFDVSGSDVDRDGLILEQELFLYHTDPYNSDSDHDGLSDSEELERYNTNPLDPYSFGGIYQDGISAKLGDVSPFSFPEGSTNTVIEHLFYSGTTNGVFAYPESTETKAVLKISVYGSGEGRLSIGDKVVPLIAPGGARRSRSGDEGEKFLSYLISLTKGVSHKISYFIDKPIQVVIDSEDFAYGTIPLVVVNSCTGTINFPFTHSTVPCIHDLRNKKIDVFLHTGEDVNLLSCIWEGSGGVEVKNISPKSASILNPLKMAREGSVSYEISHPQYLFGKTSFDQMVDFCPKPEDLPPGAFEDSRDQDEVDHNDWCCEFSPNTCYGEECSCMCHIMHDDSEEDYDPADYQDTCSEHGVSYDQCAARHSEEYTEVASSFPNLDDVLYIRDPPQYHTIDIETRPISNGCCGCSKHYTNYVSVVDQSYRLLLVDEDGNDFYSTNNSCSLKVAGVYPSRSLGDANLLFSRNGEIYKYSSNTVLGVSIRGEGFDLSRYNSLNSSFGYPVSIGPNVDPNTALRFVADVNFPTGNITISFVEATGSFALWRYDYRTGEYSKFLDSDTMPEKTLPFKVWYKLGVSTGTLEQSQVPLCITSSSEGSAKIGFRYWAVIDGKLVEDYVEQVVSSVLPLKVDMDNDGVIGNSDIGVLNAGGVFRFWVNEDNEKGDYVGSDNNNNCNTNDLVINGKYDLVNFFPIALDLKRLQNAWGERVKYVFNDEGRRAVNFCFANLPWNSLRDMQINNVATLSGEELCAAQLTKMPQQGIELPDGLLAQFSDGAGAVICEATSNSCAIKLDVKLDDKVIYSYSMPIDASSINDMYRWIDLRWVAESGANGNVVAQVLEPRNRPDCECDGRHFVFVHGYNVNAASARAWANQMFKRLWWAGSKSMFTAIDWKGDESQIYVPTQGDVSPNYYINVRHAFMTAQAVATNINALAGEKIMLAHSLGNMLVSSAAKDHGLNYSKYYMLNAAVPIEAYDSTANNDFMIDGAWSVLPPKFRVSRWYDQFSQAPYENDFRGMLSWKGRFAGIVNAVNCYSPTEDVLSNPTEIKIFGKEIGENFGGAWSKQELFKGCSLWAGVNIFTFAGAEIEGGWGINSRYMLNPLAYVSLVGFNASYFADYAREDLIIKPLFSSMNDSRMHSTNVLNFVDAKLRAKMLGDAIPAESFAAGANEISGFVNYNIQAETPNGWPEDCCEEKNGVKIQNWCHSDIKNVSYYFVYKLFEKIKEGN